ncbi:MAG: Asp-tRNA(Asn)/Glu-tRNA(Gln) amidotransferase subunit GatC [Lachnospiraceae bacterium]|nr:Asp-tRNA(Asn)/Glu-tRNA(Gln) amidotransferase subunit GatC [Lachnospiraceae bacterium]
MVKVDETVLEKAEVLSKLQIAPSERERTMREMEMLLAYVERLNEVDTEGVLPLSHGESGESSLRADVVTNPDGREAVLLNAPEQRDGQFVVPKTV